jgi:LmbE family N-acetylglucosaminyl deacetylase
MKILAIGAHFDDVEIGCGGTLIRHVTERGDDVTILTVTSSEYTLPNGGFSRSSAVAYAEAETSARLIGAKLLCMGKEPLNLIHTEQLAHELNQIVKEIGPDLVLTHWGGDFHSDHSAVSLSSVRAARHVGTILLYRSNWYHTEATFDSNYYVNISNYLKKKLDILRVYKSVLESVNYSWIDFIRKQNEYEGLRIGVDAAENFMCIKNVEW